MPRKSSAASNIRIAIVICRESNDPSYSVSNWRRRELDRRAIEVLHSEGLVATGHGADTYVRRFERILRVSPDRLAHERWGAGKAIQNHDTGTRPRTVDVVVGEQPAPDYVAEA